MNCVRLFIIFKNDILKYVIFKYDILRVWRKNMVEFYFREEELNILQNFYSNEKQKSMAIFGRRRIGKSELILHFIRNLNNAYYYQVNSLDV